MIIDFFLNHNYFTKKKLLLKTKTQKHRRWQITHTSASEYRQSSINDGYTSMDATNQESGKNYIYIYIERERESATLVFPKRHQTQGTAARVPTSNHWSTRELKK